jgi:hypothetical protein
MQTFLSEALHFDTHFAAAFAPFGIPPQTPCLQLVNVLGPAKIAAALRRSKIQNVALQKKFEGDFKGRQKYF